MTPDAASIASRLTKAKRSGSGWVACCPAHEDSTPSLSINDGEKGPVFKCHAGCSQESVLNAIEALGVQIRKTNGANGHSHEGPQEYLTFAGLSAAKGIAPQTLEDNHVNETSAGLTFDYISADGEMLGAKVRRHLGGNKGFSWIRGEKDQRSALYGLWRLEKDYANDGRVILCEGETDSLLLWQFGYTALGIPGVDNWKDEWFALIPEDAKVYVVIEADGGGEKLEEKFRNGPHKKRVSFIHMPANAKDPCLLHMVSSEGFTVEFDKLIASAEPAFKRLGKLLDWKALASQEPPQRQWAIDHWFGMGHVTLLAGAGGTGKTSVAQALASCLALRREYLDWVPKERRILFWACEDDADELHRRQIAIAAGLKVQLPEFADKLFLRSYDGEQVELAGISDGKLVAAPMLSDLYEQVGDYNADIIVLDNIARLYGGNENDRHQVTNFIAMLTGAARPTNAAILLLGHPGKALGSEYSGSTAWEGAARSRLYLGRDLPDKEPEKDQEDDDGVRYLARRKANYSTRDWRKIVYRDGVMVPEEAPMVPRGTAPTGEYVQEVVARAVRQLANMGQYGNASTASPEYLPKLAEQYKLLENVSRSVFAAATRQMELAGKIKMEVVGKYSNRTAKRGYVLCAKDNP